MKGLKWIESGGGPLVLVAKPLISEWLGTKGSKDADSLTDYQRACSVGEEIGTTSLCGSEVLVLGDEPDRTALIGISPKELLIVRWRWAESEESLVSGLIAEVDRLPFAQSGAFSTIAGEHLLFDSACSGADTEQSLSTVMEATECIVETASFEPDKSMFALVHRLRSK